MSAEAVVDLHGAGLHARDDRALPGLALVDASSAHGPHRAEGTDAAHGRQRVEDLCEKMAAVCESAVDALEIAAALEFDGMGDRSVRRRYGLPDVFTLAEEMYRRVPRRPAEPPATTDPYRTSRLRPLLHSLLYGLPAICFPAASGLLAAPSALVVLIMSMTTSWSISQGLAYLGFRRLAWTEIGQTKRLLRGGVVFGVAAVLVVMAVTSLVVPAHPGALAFGVGQGTYMLGASVMMVLAVERLLLVVLAPSVVGSTSFLLLGKPAVLEHAAWAALAATPVLALVIATVCTGRTGKRKPGRVVTITELRDALPAAGFGLLAAGLLALPVAAAAIDHRPINTGALLASLPLSLSMGAAEWSLYWYRRRMQRLLRSAVLVGGFGRQARLILACALLQYLTVGAALTAAAVMGATAAGLIHPHWSVLPELVAYLALGGAMFLCLLLQTFGVRNLPLLACAGALALEIGFHAWGVSAQVVADLGLFILLAACSTLLLGRAAGHAY